MTSWKEIQRLAADLQRVQLAENVKRLGENNCIELVTKLMSNGSIDIVIANDGKEYITRKHLVTEVQNECLANDNRIALTELAARLNVELDHVEGAISNLAKQSDSFIVCAGELIHRDYINDLCQKVNERLQESGHLSVLQLTKSWDLSTEIINNYLLPEIGDKILAVRMEDYLYTPSFLDVSRNKLTAALAAVTKVTSLSVIQSQLDMKQLLFFKLWNELMDHNEIPGQLLGGKNSLKSLYLPNIHLQNVKKFVKRTLLENNFLECSILKKLGVIDQNVLLKECLSKEEFDQLIFLPSAIIDHILWDELENSVQETIKSNQFCEIDQSVPQSLSNCLSSIDNEKIASLLSQKNQKWRVTPDFSIVYDPLIVKKMSCQVEEFVMQKAKNDAPAIMKALKSGKKSPPSKRKAAANDEEDWGSGKGNKKKTGKKGGGGPASKQKATSEEPQDCHSTTTTIQKDALICELEKTMKLPEELLNELVDEFESTANELYRNGLENALQAVSSTGAEEQRKAHEENLVRLRRLYTSIFVFEESVSAFDEKLSDDLKQYLLKGHCVEFANAVLATFVNNFSTNNVSIKARTDAIAAIGDAELRDPVKNLFECLQTMEKFHEGVFGLRNCQLLIKQPDKTARQDFVSTYSAELASQLTESSDPPVVLLLAVLTLFNRFHKMTLHASGKFVSQLTAFLASNNTKGDEAIIPTEMLELVLETQKLVVAQLTKRRVQNEEDASKIEQNIVELKAFLSNL